MQEITRNEYFNEDRGISRSLSFETMQRINDMRDNNEFCDSSIQIFSENEGLATFNIHRNILSAASHYFE
jgi:hypothetical protein